MKVGKIIHGTALGAGYIGLICYGGMMASMAFDYVKTKVKAHKSRKWKEGYDAAAKDMKNEIEYLKEENTRLMKEAYKRSEAAE